MSLREDSSGDVLCPHCNRKFPQDMKGDKWITFTWRHEDRASGSCDGITFACDFTKMAK